MYILYIEQFTFGIISDRFGPILAAKYLLNELAIFMGSVILELFIVILLGKLDLDCFKVTNCFMPNQVPLIFSLLFKK